MRIYFNIFVLYSENDNNQQKQIDRDASKHCKAYYNGQISVIYCCFDLYNAKKPMGLDIQSIFF